VLLLSTDYKSALAGNFELQATQRDMIRDKALEILLAQKPDVLVTSCPACKKAFSKGNTVLVKDIAEVVSKALVIETDKMVTTNIHLKVQETN
jgi:hypothetical protein